MNLYDQIFRIYPIGYVKRGENSIKLEIIKRFIPALKKIDYYSHIHIIWWAHKADKNKYRNSDQRLQIETPYGEESPTTGIFALRGVIRPNPIAISIAKLLDVNYKKGYINIQDLDAIEDTPIIDIKPYEPVRDRVKDPIIPHWLEVEGVDREWFPQTGLGLKK